MERFYFEVPNLNRKQDAINFLKELKTMVLILMGLVAL